MIKNRVRIIAFLSWHLLLTTLPLLSYGHAYRNGDAGRRKSTGCKAPEVSIQGRSLSGHNINFSDVHEVQFVGIIGPLEDKRTCKIQCLDGVWIGPMCTIGNDESRFQPMLRPCSLSRRDPEVSITYNGRRIDKTGMLDFPHGSVLSASCRQVGKFKFNGNGTMTCTNGNWYNGNPTCTPTTLYQNLSVNSPPTILYDVASGDVGTDDDGTVVILPQSIVHFDCIYKRQNGNPQWNWSANYRQYPTGWVFNEQDRNLKYRISLYYAKRADSGIFTCKTPQGHDNSLKIAVKDVKCPLLHNHDSNRVLNISSNALNAVAKIRCNEGYKLDGPEHITCKASGRWSDNIPKCKIVSCNRILPDDQHVLMNSHHTEFRSRVAFSCPSGYRLIGPHSIRCMKDGSWSGNPPYCKMAKCKQPMPPIHGTVLETGRYMIGDYVQYTCLPGYKLAGQAISVCNDKGKWSHPSPSCHKMCDFPGEPKNGKLNPTKFYYSVGDKIHITCNEQYRPIGPLTLKCKSNAKWSGPMPTCT